MTAFLVPEGTTVVAIQNREDSQYRHQVVKTKKENMFFREDIILDPMGELSRFNSTAPEDAGVHVIAMMAPLGYNELYGFRARDLDTGKRSPWAMLVRVSEVQTD